MKSKVTELFSRNRGVRAPSGTGISAKQLSLCSTAEARALLEYDLALKFEVLPLGIVTVNGAQVLTCACPKGQASSLLSAMRFAAGRDVKLIEVKESILQQSILRAYNGNREHLKVHLEKVTTHHSDAPFTPSPIHFRGSCNDVARLLEALLDHAVAHTASDLHLIPFHDGCHTRLRIHGELYHHTGALYSLEVHRQMVARLKVLSGLDTTNHTLPQESSLRIPYGGRDVHARISTMPTVHGEKVVLRLASLGEIMKLSNLGFDDRTLTALHALISKPHGAIIFSGPTGSGKTTSMYSVLQELRRENLNIVSVEDPVEVFINGVTQTSICEKQSLTYATCLRSILRQDPDVIMIGEIRDAESARYALQAALTGHLVLSTVHARDVFEVFLRLRNLQVDSLTIAQAVELVICQELVPVLCEQCKVIDLIRSNEVDYNLFKPVGCTECDYSGYGGRTLVAESLSLNEALRERIRGGKITRAALEPCLKEEIYSSRDSSVEYLSREGRVALQSIDPIP